MNEKLLKEINLNVRFVNQIVNSNNINHKLPWRKLIDYEILYVTKGEITVKTKTKEYTVRQNQLHIMPPHLYHTRYFKDNDIHCDYFNIHLDFFHTQQDDFTVDDTYRRELAGKGYLNAKRLERRSCFENIKTIELIDVHHPEDLTEIFKQLLKAYKNDDDPYKLITIKHIGYKLLLQLLQECQENGVVLFEYKKNLHIDIVEDFVNYVNKNYSKKIDLNELSEKYALSKNHFCKIFKKQYNISPHSFIVTVRIDEAKRLLKSGKYLVNEIATLVGYDDFTYFSRIFKIKEGVSPLNYLKESQNHQ